MIYQQNFTVAAMQARDADLRTVCVHLADQGSALAEAAHKLGGQAASSRVLSLIEALRDARRLTHPHRRQLVNLHKLLTLEHVGDPDRIEAALFMDLDPGSPEVDEICLLAESLEELLKRISSDERSDGRRPGADAPFAEVA